jgi:hypothetical protein
MAALNPPGSLPSEMQAIIRLLLSATGHSMPRPRVEQLVTPTTLQGSISDGGGGQESDTIRVMRLVGFIGEEKGELVLNRQLAKAIGRDVSSARIRRVVRRAFLANVGMDEAKTSNAGAADLARTAAWYLLQDPLDPPMRWDGDGGVQELRQRQLRFEEPILENNTRWGALDRWMPYLGLAVHDHRDSAGRASLQVLVPDPTFAVRDELTEILPQPRVQKPLKDVLGELGRACPVLDGGVYQRAVIEMLLPNSLPVADGTISRSLSHSLLRLQDWSEITLHDRADADKVALRVGADAVAYSHVERLVP